MLFGDADSNAVNGCNDGNGVRHDDDGGGDDDGDVDERLVNTIWRVVLCFNSSMDIPDEGPTDFLGSTS